MRISNEATLIVILVILVVSMLACYEAWRIRRLNRLLKHYRTAFFFDSHDAASEREIRQAEKEYRLFPVELDDETKRMVREAKDRYNAERETEYLKSEHVQHKAGSTHRSSPWPDPNSLSSSRHSHGNWWEN